MERSLRRTALEDSAAEKRKATGEPSSAPLKRARITCSAEEPVNGPASMLQSSASEAVRNQAANTIIRAMRKQISNKSVSNMLRTGEMWKNVAQVLVEAGLFKHTHEFSLQRLSSINLSQLRKRLGQLTKAEAAFFDHFTRQTFFATHFTDAKLDHAPMSFFERFRQYVASYFAGAKSDEASISTPTMSIFSRQKLERHGIAFAQSHTWGWDSVRKGDDDCVFFSLECGNNLKKLSSRFGKTVYRIPLDTPVFQQVAWASLDDFVMSGQTGDQQTPARLKWLNPKEKVCLSEIWGHPYRGDYRRAEDFNDIFTGKDLVAGAALSILYKLRVANHLIHTHTGYGSDDDDFNDEFDYESVKLSEDTPLQPGVAKLLESSTEEDINALIRVFHNPEIRVPVHFFTKNFEKFGPKEIRAIREWNSMMKDWAQLSDAQRNKLRKRIPPAGAMPLPLDPADF